MSNKIFSFFRGLFGKNEPKPLNEPKHLVYTKRCPAPDLPPPSIYKEQSEMWNYLTKSKDKAAKDWRRMRVLAVVCGACLHGDPDWRKAAFYIVGSTTTTQEDIDEWEASDECNEYQAIAPRWNKQYRDVEGQYNKALKKLALKHSAVSKKKGKADK